MNFFEKIKELANLRKTIDEENKKLQSIKIEEQNSTENLKKLSFKLEDKKKLMNDIREVLESENEQRRNSIVLEAKVEADLIKKDANEELSALLASINNYQLQNEELKNEHDRLIKEINRYNNQARKFKSEIVGLKEFNKKYEHALTCNIEPISTVIEKISTFLKDDGLLDTIIKLPLHSDNSKELRKLSNATRKEINSLLETYEARYTTKGNKAIYNLMIVGLQSEIQLLLSKLTYQKLDDTKSMLDAVLTKYLMIAGEGNKSILPTITRFISEIEPLYIELIDIEYRYYIYRQREKEEQQAIKEQMKQEAEERKALEIERKKLEKEESKYLTEMNRNKELLEKETDNEKITILKLRLEELQDQLNNVAVKKEEVTSLAMGKAGYVYIISNLGSFGENIFKIGMTRRLEPQQRVDELGSASVPFRFDVHAMIFSDDAVGLENTLHKRLSENRVNKVNFRKEFFKTNINNLELLVEEIDPTAEFTKTMFSEEFQQTLAIEDNLKEVAN